MLSTQNLGATGQSVSESSPWQVLRVSRGGEDAEYQVELVICKY